jgi:phage protein D
VATLDPIKPIIVLNWAGRHVTQDLSGYVKSITYTESKRKKSAGRDRVQLTLDNSTGIFTSDWYPQSGDVLQPGVSWLDLITGKLSTWRWGRFTIDDVRFRFGPDEVTIGALASGKAADKLEQNNNRNWDNISLRLLCTTLAAEAGMECSFTGDDTIIDHVQQRNESSRELLTRLAEQYNLPVSLKDATVYVGSPKLGTLTVSMKNRSVLKSADIVSSSPRNTAHSVVVHYYNDETKESGTYSTGKVTDDKHTLQEYNVQVSNLAEAKRYAQSKAAAGGGKHQAESRLELINTPAAVGQPVHLTDAGKLPADWTIAQQTTSVTNSTWKTTIKMTKKG